MYYLRGRLVFFLSVFPYKIVKSTSYIDKSMIKIKYLKFSGLLLSSGNHGNSDKGDGANCLWPRYG